MTFSLRGETNDYTGKGMSGGVVSVRPPEAALFRAEENMIVGNTVLYGATAGRAFFRGLAGERFAVRNSGACAVVEGVGDHGCEYMTGGRVVVLGPTGRNFAAGMSGGIAYVFDQDRQFAGRCNTELVDLEQMGDEDADEVKALISEHAQRTGSLVARNLLASWDRSRERFVKVMPRDYKRALEEQRLAARVSAPRGRGRRDRRLGGSAPSPTCGTAATPRPSRSAGRASSAARGRRALRHAPAAAARASAGARRRTRCRGRRRGRRRTGRCR